MKFELDSVRSGLVIKSYEGDCVIVGDTRHVEPFVITPDGIHTGLVPLEYRALSRVHLEAVAATGAQIVLVGSGRRQIFLSPGIVAEMGARGVGVEVMGTAAACRCYNVLAAEQRAIAAVLYIH